MGGLAVFRGIPDLQVKENMRNSFFFNSLAWRREPVQSRLISGQRLSTPRSDIEREWDETEEVWKTRSAGGAWGLACVARWIWLNGLDCRTSLYCIKQRDDLQKCQLRLKGKVQQSVEKRSGLLFLQTHSRILKCCF